MLSDFVKTFLAFMTILFACEEGRHACNHVVVIVMLVQVEAFLSFGTRVYKSVKVFQRHNIKLIARKDILELLDLRDTTCTEGNTGSNMELAC